MRFRTMVISLLVTLLLLFSGFYVYQSIYIKGAIEDEIVAKPQLTIQNLEIDQQEVRLNLKVGKDFSINSDYYPLQKAIQSHIGNRELVMQLTDQPNEALTNLWNELNFTVREGIEQQKYTKVLETVKEMTKKKKDISYQVNLDEHYLYIVLQEDEYFLIRAIPLQNKAASLNKTEGEVNYNE
jgi:hypothetical protein